MEAGEHALAMTHKTRLREIKHLDSRNVFKFVTIASDIKGFTKSKKKKKKVKASWFLPVLSGY